VIALDHRALDVSDRGAVLAAVTTVEPDAIVHAAAWTDVDACESDPDHAFAVNGLGSRHVAEAARRCDAFLCAISTDYVFGGDRTEPYREWDTTEPLSVYGHSKLAGEHETLAAPNAAVVRLSLVFSEHGNNLAKRVVELERERPELAFVDDQRSSPTSATDAAVTIKRLVVERRPGLFHVTNHGTASPYEFACEVFRAVDADPSRIRPIATAELDPPRAASRPMYSVLDNMAVRLAGLPPLPEWRASLRTLVRSLVA